MNLFKRLFEKKESTTIVEKTKPIDSQEELRRAVLLAVAEMKANETLIADAVRRAAREKEIEQAVDMVKRGLA